MSEKERSGVIRPKRDKPYIGPAETSGGGVPWPLIALTGCLFSLLLLTILTR